MSEQPIRIISIPGIKRDGTRLEGDNYIDGQWVRFQRGLPRKIGGYRSVNRTLRGQARTLHEYTQNDLTYLHAGSSERLERVYIDGALNTGLVYDRTPAGLTASDNNLWQFDVETTAAATGLQLVAHVAANGSDISSSAQGQLFYGSLFNTSALTAVTALPAPATTNGGLSGGVVALHPYTVAFGSDGFVMWSPDCADFTVVGAGNAYVTGQKIVVGKPFRGGPGSSPSGLLWSLDSLIRMTYVGGTAGFEFDTISAESSIMSSSCVVEYDGIFYWIGTDRFLQFNGVVREIENGLNSNFFFDNLNYNQRQKVFAFKVPRFGEIWWCFPFGNSTVANHAIIYNVRENTWYDTALPNNGRSAATFPAIFRKPIAVGTEPQNYTLYGVTSIASAGTGYTAGDVVTVDGGTAIQTALVTILTVDGSGGVLTVSVSRQGEYSAPPTGANSPTGGTGSGLSLNLDFATPYKIWIHEIGVDQVDGANVTPIQSYFETADISLPVTAQINKAMRVSLMEPDFVQTGPMTVAIHGRANARSPEVESVPLTIPETAETPQEQVAFFKEQRRQLRFRFESNCIGGDYQMGLILAHVGPGDGTVLG